MPTWSKPIKSGDLKKIFQSFHVDIPDEPAKDSSFVREILNIDALKKLVTEIKLLTNGVVLTSETEDVQPGNVYVYEVEVVCNEEGLAVVEKVSHALEDFFPNRDNIAIVILIKSSSIYVADAKLAVYNKYTEQIRSKDIFLHHVVEDFDEVSKLSAHLKISPFCEVFTSLIGQFSLYNPSEIVRNAVTKYLTKEKVREVCLEENIVGREPYFCYSIFTVRRLKKELVENTISKIIDLLVREICHGIIQHIESVVQKTLEEDFFRFSFRMSDEIYTQIRGTIAGVIFAIFQGITDIIIAIGFFVITIINPVDVNSVVWRQQVADEISEKMLEDRHILIHNTTAIITKIYDKTVNYLQNIELYLERFRTRLPMTDQKKLFNLLEKRHFVHDRKKLESHPSLLQYIAGNNTEDQPVVEIFYRDDNTDNEFESFCKNCCTVSDDTKFKFVPVSSTSKTFKKVSTLEVGKKMDILSKKKLGQFIDENEDRIYASYSNVIGIGIGYVDDEPQNEPCIVLYCLDKNIIPFGERPLPKDFKEFDDDMKCDIREDFVRFGKCPIRCPSANKSFPEPGCSIGIAKHESTGSVGFLVEDKHSPKYCFLTASHVVVKDYQNYYRENIISPMTRPKNDGSIVHHGRVSDVEVGEVTEYFFGNYKSREGVDIALVKGELVRTDEKEKLIVVKYNDLDFKENLKVEKTGKSTGKTEGCFKHNKLSLRMKGQLYKHCIFKQCYAIENEEEVFFTEGDSGSGVFLRDNVGTLFALGIAFAYMNSQTAVCRIDTAVKELGLTLVSYSRIEEPMDCS